MAGRGALREGQLPDPQVGAKKAKSFIVVTGHLTDASVRPIGHIVATDASLLNR